MAAVNSWKIYWVWGRNLGVQGEKWPEYPQMVIYRSPKISHESYVAFGQKRQKAKMAAGRYFEKKIDF